MHTQSKGANYANFTVAVYTRVHEVLLMRDPAWLEERWARIAAQLKIDKVYLEPFRDRVVADEGDLLRIKKFFTERGIETAAGLALTVDEPNRFITPCYTDPEDRALVRRVVEIGARCFDEIILDDFFFTNTKFDSDIAAKGDRSWTEFRLELMRAAGRDLVLDPARAVNPKVKVVIKYPNWYEHFQGLGFDLELQPAMFDGVYTGTETRHPEYNAQHLQQYEGYAIMRYFENIAPGRNGGGWVDTGGLRYLDRFAEQIWLTLFAKAREITLFDFRQMLYPVRDSLRGNWQGMGTSFDYDRLVAPHRRPDGTLSDSLTMAGAAAAALEQVDGFADRLGTPIGIASYRPPQSTGDEFLHNYIGMVGIPMDIRPAFPQNANSIFLTEAAKSDPDLLAKIEERLRAGARVLLTSQLIAALQTRGLDRIVEWTVTDRRVLTQEFYLRDKVVKSDRPVLLPQIEYYTNDSWELVGAHANGHPLLLECAYSAGAIFGLAVPDDAADLYLLSAGVLDAIRGALMADSPFRLEGPGRVSLFLYDNDTAIIESFRDEPCAVELIVAAGTTSIRDIVTGDTIAAVAKQVPTRRWGETETAMTCPVNLPPHSFRVFQAERT